MTRSRLALFAILVGNVLLRLRLLAVPLERDEGEYAYIGQLILQGEVPYLAAHNMKLPGVYYAYAALLGLFGEHIVAIRIGLLLISTVTIVLIERLGRRLLDPTAGVTAAAAYAVLSLSQSVVGYSANAEHFVVLPMLAGVLLLAGLDGERRLGRAATAGVLLGIAVVMKQHGAAFVVFGVLYLLLTTPALLPPFVLGALLPFAITCVAMALAGAFAPFWFWTVTYARQYASLLSPAEGLRLLRIEAVRIVGTSPPLWLLAALGLAAIRRDRSARFLFPFTLCSLAAVVPGLRFSDHYFVLVLPAVSLLAGAAVSALARAVATRAPAIAPLVRVGLPLAAIALVLAKERAYLFAPSPAAVSRAVHGANPFPEAIEIGHWVRAHTAPGDRIAVIGSEPEIYFYAGRRAATSYIYMYPLMEPHPFAEHMQKEMIAQLERDRPRVLVLVNVDRSWSRRPTSSTAVLDWAERTVARDYDAVGLVEIEADGAATYRWDAEAAAATPRSPNYVAVFLHRRETLSPFSTRPSRAEPHPSAR